MNVLVESKLNFVCPLKLMTGLEKQECNTLRPPIALGPDGRAEVELHASCEAFERCSRDGRLLGKKI